MSNLKEIYQVLKSRGLIKTIRPEYEDAPISPEGEIGEDDQENEMPATVEVAEHKPEFLKWFYDQPINDQKDFQIAFGKL